MAFRPSMGGIGGLGDSTSVSGVDKPMNADALIAHLVEMTPDQRKQFASMHSDDPMMLSAAKYVDNKFKQDAQNLMARQSGAQPPVNQQAVASMAGTHSQQMPQQGQMQQAPQQAQGLPEESGIGALPAPNMQKMAGGGIVAFGDGGDIDGYDKGGAIQNAGSDPTAAYKAYAQAKAAKMGVDPALVDSIFNIESGYDPEAKSPTGPVGIGQLTKSTGKAYGVDPKDRTDPYKNIDASVAYMADLQKKYGSDPSKIAVAYNQGEPVLNSHLRANGGKMNPQKLPSEAQGYLKKLNDLLPFSSAQAESLPPPTGQTDQSAPATETPPDASGLARLAAYGKSKALPQFTRMDTAQPVPGAPETLPQTVTQQLESQKKMTLQQRTDAQREALANEVPEGYTRQPMQNDPRYGLAGLTQMNTSEQGPPISAMNPPQEPQQPAPEQPSAATAAPAKNPNEWSADDWMALAAGLGQNKSQYFSEALGGGLQNLVANRAARRKYDMENLLNTAHANQLNALTEAYGPRGELALARAAQLGNAPNAAALKAQQQSIEFQVKSAQSDLAKLRGSVGAMYDPDIKMQMAKLQSTIDTGMQRLNALQTSAPSGTMPTVPAAPQLAVQSGAGTRS